MLFRRPRGPALICAVLALSACGQERVRITPLPVDLTTCADEPNAPSLPERDGTQATELARDTLTLAYVLALRSAWGDCRAKVDGAKAFNDSL